jgi:outer membrane receptor protein involved in Fe transport
MYAFVRLVRLSSALFCVPILLLGGLTVEGSAQTGQITGQVRAALSQSPVEVAQVHIPQLLIGTLTRSNGSFLLLNVPAGTHQLLIERIGYRTESREVTVMVGQTLSLVIEMADQALSLDEVIVTGTAGAARRREIGNTVAQIRAADLDFETVFRTEDVLAASAPGVQLTLGSGDPGAGQAIRIRGVNSLTQGNRPLIYIDGVRMESETMPRQRTTQRAGALNSINPDDIDRIEIVKGSAATTLYGTEASAGVIQIFTKRGVQGPARWTMEYSPTLTAPPRNIGPTPDPGWVESWLGTDCTGPGGGVSPCDASNLFMNPWTKTRMGHSVDLSVRGGTSAGEGAINYFVSGGWQNEVPYYDEARSGRFNLRTNLGYTPTSWLNIQSNTSFAQTHSVFVTGIALNTWRGPVNFLGGDLNRAFDDFDDDEWINHLTTGLQFIVTPTTSLQMRLNVGVDYLDNRQTSTTFYGHFRDPGGRRWSRSWNSTNKTLDFATTYTRDVLGISLTSAAGLQVFQNVRRELYGEAAELAGPGNPTVSFGSPWSASEDLLEEINAGFFIQEVLGFRDKAFLTLGMRMDGNSAFGKDYGLQSYPKASLSYVISEEGFWPTLFDDTKLRFAYGESGRAPGHFDAEQTWNPISARGGQAAVTPISLGNPSLGPERTKELEGGFETSLLDNRLIIDFTHYRQTTVDALINVPVDPSLGIVAPQIANVGRIDNWGTEVALDASLVQTPSFGWSVGVMATFQQSEVKDLGGGVDQIRLSPSWHRAWARVGYPLPSYFGNVPQNPAEFGAPIFEEEFIGPQYPTRLFNISTRLRIGQNLTLSARAERQAGQYVFGSGYWLGRRQFWPACHTTVETIAAGRIDEIDAEERWRCSPADLLDTGWISPAAFWKLRSVNATYRLPEGFLDGSLGRLTLSVGGRDLWRRFNDGFIGVDPEEQQGGDTLTRAQCYRTPPPRIFQFSVRSEF